MLTRTYIRSLADEAAYNKGLSISRSDKIRGFRALSGDDGCDLTAVVKGHGAGSYMVSLKLDREEKEVTGAFCECPAFYSYPGICKHCVAMLLAFAEYRSSGRKPAGGTGLREYAGASGRRFSEAGSSGGKRAAGGRQERETDGALRQMLAGQLLKRTLAAAGSQYHGKVNLEPNLVCGPGEITVEFKIGVSYYYIMKDVFGFAAAVESGAVCSYGKKLEFVHTVDAFSPESRPLVRFLLNWTEQNIKHYRRSDYSVILYGEVPSLRSVPLTLGELEDLLEALPERTVSVNVMVRPEAVWRLCSDSYVPEVKITGEKDGLRVQMGSLLLYRSRSSYLFFEENGLNIHRVSAEPLEPLRDFLRVLEGKQYREVFVSRKDAPVFCRELLPLFRKLCRCETENFAPEDYGVEEVSFEIYLDAPQKDLITCRLLAVYGEKKEDVFGARIMDPARDAVRELEVSREISGWFNAYDEKYRQMVLAEDEELLFGLLTEGIPRMQELGQVFISDAMRRLKVADPPRVTAGVNLSGGLLELEVTSTDLSMEELAELLGRYSVKRKFYRLRNGSFIQAEGSGISALAKLRQGLHFTEKQLLTGKITVPGYRALFLDGEMKEGQALRFTKSRSFRALVRNMKTVDDNDYEVPETLAGILRGYQRTGFLWLKTLKDNGFGGILADDMGLGKTLQVIAFLLSEAGSGGRRTPGRTERGDAGSFCLIVSPASLVYNWKNEIGRFAPSLRVRMITGSAEERKSALREAEDGEILLTSYDLLKRDLANYEGIHFFCQVVDEAQYIKNFNTQTAKAVKSMDADFRLALTGTPVENRLSELWSIFDFLMPGFLYSYTDFRRELELPIVQKEDWKAAERLTRMIRPFVLRRLKKDVLSDLPDKLEENLAAVLEGEQRKLYDAHVARLRLMLDRQSEDEFSRSKIQILAELTKLRQLCCDPALLFEDYDGVSAKLELCMDLLRNAVEGGHKILLFSQFTTMLDRIRGRLDREGISSCLLTGATGKEKRAELVESFGRNDTSVFCISLKAGGTGLNLTAADIVIHYDPWWNLAVQNQATDRAHRIGQKNVVSVYRLLVKDSIEERIVKLQEKKRELADRILGGEGLDGVSFSREELLELLGGRECE